MNEATHECGHTLDLVITRQTDSILSSKPEIGRFFSDHNVINCSLTLNSVKPPPSVKSVTYRKVRDIDIKQLRKNLASSELIHITTSNIDLDVLVDNYNSTLSGLLDHYAPLRRKTVTDRPRVPWFNDDIRSAVSGRRRAERKWRSSKQPYHHTEFKKANDTE